MTTFSPESRAILKTSMGDIAIEFLTDKAPRTCEHFVKLARKGFYEGLTFHRILKDFMVQGGCPKGDGTGGPGFTVRAEFNDTPHVQGVVSMARGADPHSAGSQFFLVHGESRYLDSRYTAFARVSDGMDVLDKIANMPVGENRYKELSLPREPIFINRIVLEGIEFDADDAPAEGAADARRNPAAGAGRTVAQDSSTDDEAAAEADADGDADGDSDDRAADGADNGADGDAGGDADADAGDGGSAGKDAGDGDAEAGGAAGGAKGSANKAGRGGGRGSGGGAGGGAGGAGGGRRRRSRRGGRKEG
jgi:peptidyl-prolyl cis-trans isomerase B (cyclophilin B)